MGKQKTHLSDNKINVSSNCRGDVEETDWNYSQLLAKDDGSIKLGTIIYLAKEPGVSIINRYR